MVKQVISLFFFVLIASVLFSCGNSGNTVSVKDIELRQKAKMDSLMQLAKQDSTIRATPKAEENYISTDTTIFNAQQAQIEEQQIDTSFNGEKILYYPGGKKFKQANYTKGILNGECITYYENGTVWAIEHFVNDTFQGQRIIYFENG
ncbi:MAG TPA: hypothetical protein VKG26_03005, partial [Bacteroidia bacterium]|nr:hypothetical protein [Bacteroidia bacterium]